MRIVLVSFDMPWSLRGGVEHHVDRLATALARDHGDEVTVVTRESAPPGKRAYRTLRAAVPRGARAIGGAGYRFRLLSEGAFARRASDLAGAARADVVHFQDFAGRPDRVVPARTAATIHVPHEVNLEEGRRNLAEQGRLSWWRRAAMERFHARQVARARGYLAALDHVFTVSQANAEVLRRAYHIQPIVIPNGVDPLPPDLPDRSRARQALGWPADKRVVLFLGRLEPAKRPLLLLQQASATTQVVFAGAGSLAGELQDAAAQDPHVTFLGPVGDDQKLELLRAADVVALPSRAEGQPVVLLEALSVGTPVYATSADWLPPELHRFAAFGDDVGAGLERAASRRVPAGVVPTWSDVAKRYRLAYRSHLPGRS